MLTYLTTSWIMLALSIIGYGAVKKNNYYRIVSNTWRTRLILSSSTSLIVVLVHFPWEGSLVQAIYIILLSSFFIWLLSYEKNTPGNMWLTWKLIVPIDNVWRQVNLASKAEESKRYTEQAQFLAKTLCSFLPLLELLPCTDGLCFHASLRQYHDGREILYNPDP